MTAARRRLFGGFRGVLGVGGVAILLGAASWLTTAPLAGLVATAQAADSKDKGGKKQPTIPVIAASAITGDIGVYLNGLGSVVPYNTVVVKSRVAGQLIKVHFSEGQLVRAGDLLAEVDPRPFAVQVAQAEGQLARDEALLKNAQADLERYRSLRQTQAVSQQVLSTQEATVAQYAGIVQSDRAQLDSAKLNLAYARITAPIAGRAGLRLLDAGNMVGSGDGLLTITQVEPVAAIFAIPQDQAPPVLKKLRAGARLTVLAYDREQKQRLAEGRLLTVDNQIDASTGTLKCKAVFNNSELALYPNQFINARLLVDLKRGVTLVPNAAVQRGAEQSAFVFVVERQAAGETTVAIRPITPGTVEAGMTEIVSGLKAGELVVLEGVDRLAAGSKVAVQMRTATAT